MKQWLKIFTYLGVAKDLVRIAPDLVTTMGQVRALLQEIAGAMKPNSAGGVSLTDAELAALGKRGDAVMDSLGPFMKVLSRLS
jgi:hypothetical protein